MTRSVIVTLLITSACFAQAPATSQTKPSTPAAKAPAPAPKPAAPAAPAAKPAAPAAKPKAAAAATSVAPKAAAPKAAVTKAASLVDAVIGLKKAGMGDDLIIKSILREKSPTEVGMTDLTRLKQAGVSDRVIGVLMDPASASAAPAPAAPAAGETPAAQPAAATAAAPAEPAPAAVPAPLASAPAEVNAKPAAPTKRRLAVDAFDYSTVKTVTQEIFKTEVNIGAGIRALLTKRLQEAGKISVLERAKINTLMQEQDFGASNRVKKGTNARIGRILGADAVLMGDIVAFGRDDRDKRVSLGAVPGVPRAFGAIRIGKKEDKAVVVINYRIVDAETSEVIDTGEARGESVRKSKGLGGMVGVGGGFGAGSIDMTSSNFAQTIIGEAVMDACDKLAASMNEKIPNLPAKAIEVEARVADVSGSKVTITAGSEAGVNVGDRFEVFKVLSELKDPVTKEVLDLKLEKVGDLIIASVRERVSEGNYGGTAAAGVGFVVQKKSTN